MVEAERIRMLLRLPFLFSLLLAAEMQCLG